MRWDAGIQRLQQEPAVTITVHSTQGSVPREAGTWMLVFAQGEWGTIGGGHLEFECMAAARAWLAQPHSANDSTPREMRFALGPTLGQCCGGVVVVHALSSATPIAATHAREGAQNV